MLFTAMRKQERCGRLPALHEKARPPIRRQLLLLLLFFFAISATFAQKVTVTGKAMTLQNVFLSIQKQTGLEFIADKALIEKAKPVDLNIRDMELADAMKTLLTPLGLTYTLRNNTIVIRKIKPDPSITDERIIGPADKMISVKGKVVDEKGVPLPEVGIGARGLKNVTLTDEDGEFFLMNVPQDAVLSFMSVNTLPLDVPLDGRTKLNVTLKNKVSVLADIEIKAVNTGYQKLNPQNFVGSYSQLDSAAYERRAGMNIIDRLDGTVSGVLFDKKTLGLTVGGNIQIRGLSTIPIIDQSPSSQPLIIVDNFPFRQDLNSINPNDVETITILKDAAATSIWGAQAGNGVIVITTKKGKYNQAMRVSASSNISIDSKPNLYYYPQTSINDFIDAEISLFNRGFYNADLGNTSSWPVISPVVEILARQRAGKLTQAEADAQIAGLRTHDIRADMDRYVYRNAVRQQHYLSLSGGQSGFNYNLSAGYNRSLNNTQYSRPDDQYSVSSQLGFKPSSFVEVTATLRYTESRSRSTSLNMAKVSPYASLADAEGNALPIAMDRRYGYVDTAGGGQLLDWSFRPLDELRSANSQNIQRNLQSNINVNFKLTSWANLSLSYNYSMQTEDGRYLYSPATYFARNEINRFTNLNAATPSLIHPLPLGGILDFGHTESFGENMRAQLNVNKKFSGQHQLTAMVAAERSANDVSSNTNRLYGYNDVTGSYTQQVDFVSTFPQYGTGAGQYIPSSARVFPAQRIRFVSLVANASYVYKDRYTLYASARKDGANVFGVNANKKWNPLWSVGASWDVTRESFFKAPWVNQLRLRGSYGYSGNPGNGTGVATIQNALNPTYFTNLPYAFIGDAPNPDLRWEKVRTINIAADFGLFKNRLRGTIDVFSKRTTDIISYSNVPPSNGYSVYIMNAADLSGRGFELTLQSQNLRSGSFKWETQFSLSHSQTLIDRIQRTSYAARSFATYGINAFEGRMAYGISSLRFAGLDPVTGDPQGYYKGAVSKNYVALLSDTVTNQVFHGSAIPLYYGNIGNSFSWKNFTLSANITYRLDFYFRKPTISYSALATGWVSSADYAQRWQQPGDEKNTTVPSFNYPLDLNRDLFYQYSEVNVLRGDNVRLQDIRLQYEIKKLPKAIQRAQIYVYANNLNLILWRKNKYGLDPDFAGGVALVTPSPVTLTAGINLTF